MCKGVTGSYWQKTEQVTLLMTCFSVLYLYRVLLQFYHTRFQKIERDKFIFGNRQIKYGEDEVVPICVGTKVDKGFYRQERWFKIS